MQVVKNLDIKRYMGRWYEIASFPSRFQPRDGMNTRATDTLNEDGTVNVLNETWTDGKRAYIEGSGSRTDPSSNNAKLKVKFYILCRENHIDDGIYNQLVQKAKGEGYDVSKLQRHDKLTLLHQEIKPPPRTPIAFGGINPSWESRNQLLVI